jgi:trk system potassium uptake protein TrkA
MQQILIVGLGQFGLSLARSLTEKGAEVLAVDRRKDLVEEASSYVAEALVVDATDEEGLAGLHPERRDACVCAIGEDSKEASIICTALLRQMGSPRVIARAGSSLHRRILQLVGAHQVVNPEQEFGQRFANRLAYQHIISDMPLGQDLHLTEIAVPAAYVGKNLLELALPKRFGIMVVALRRGQPSQVQQPVPTEPLLEGDIMIVVSSEAAIPKLIKGL